MQAGVLGEEIAAAFAKRDGVFLVIPEGRQLVVDLFPLRDRGQIIERDLVLRFDPLFGRRGIGVFEVAIRIGDFRAEIIIGLIAFRRLRINETLGLGARN